MKLEFTKLTIENFKSFVDKTELDLKSFSPGVHFVRGRNDYEPRLGSNGAGKSTLFDAFCWCLFGRTPGGLKNPDIQPWSGKKTSTVSINLRVDDARHKVQRTAHPNSLTINSETVGQEQIVSLIGMDYDIFVNTILLGQNQPLFFDLSPRDKMQLFSDVLNLERWEQRSKQASSRVSSLQTEEAELRGELEATKSNLESIEDYIKTTKMKSDEWENSRQNRLAKYEEQLRELTRRQKKVQTGYNEANITYDGAMVEVKHLTKLLDKVEKELSVSRDEMNLHKLRLDNSIMERDKLLGKLDKMGEGDACPTCGQKIKGTALDRHKRELKSEVKSLSKTIDKGIPEDFIEALHRLEKAAETTKKHLVEFREKADDALERKSQLGNKLAEIKAEVVNAKRLIETDEEQDNPHKQQLVDFRKRKKKLEREIDELAIDIGIVQRSTERAKFWIKGFKDVRLYIIDEILQELELTTNLMLPLVGLEDWKITYSIEKETKSGTVQRGLNITIQSPKNKNPVKWESWSGGEGQRLRLLGALALSEVLLIQAGVETDLEILDEPTRHLSPEGIHDLLEFLQDRSNNLGSKIFYVDHQSVESTYFDSTLTVVKDKSGASVVL